MGKTRRYGWIVKIDNVKRLKLKKRHKNRILQGINKRENIFKLNSFLNRKKLLAFGFSLSALKTSSFLNRIKLLAFCFLLLAFNACTRLPNIQGKGAPFLQGVWNQDSISSTANLLSYTKHHFKFSCDSFYVDLTTFSKVNYYEDSCFNKGVWKEYAKGTYAVKGDTLILVGTFTKANYKQKVSGCYRIGRYLSNFKIKTTQQNNIQLESLTDEREINLNLKQKINCVPKEL
jgi:hypothetical protein